MSSVAPQVRVTVNREPVMDPSLVDIPDLATEDALPRRRGPNTPEGKARVSMNALKHGLDSEQAVIGSESAQAFEDYRAALLRDTQPVGAREEDCVERMLMAQWKLHRLWRQETGAYRAYGGRFKLPVGDGSIPFLMDCQNEQAFTRMSRMESTLHRIYQQSESRLRILQDLREKGLRKAEEEDASLRAEQASGTQHAPEAVAEVPKAEGQAPVPAEAEPTAEELAELLVSPMPTLSDDGLFGDLTEQFPDVSPGRMAAD